MTTAVPALNLDEYADMLGDVANADETRLNEFHDAATARIDQMRDKIAKRELSDDELAELEGLTPALRDVTGERRTRADTRESKYGEAEAFLSEFDAANAEPETTTPEELAEGDDETDDEGGEQAETDGGESPQPPAMAAAAGKSGKRASSTTTRARVPEIGTTGAQANNGPVATTGERIPTTITAAADVRGYAGGQNVPYEQLGTVMNSRLDAMRTVGGGNGEQVSVVTIRANGMPDNRKLRRGDVGGNTNKLDAVASRAALVAAGGLCAPLAIDYSYQTTGIQGRPVRDSLPGFQAERGGIQFRPDVSPITNRDANGPRKATGRWSNQDDANAYATSNPPRKTKWIVDCPPTDTAEVEAITLQTEWSNVTSRFDPETVQANQAAALIWHDRWAENQLLDKLQNESKLMRAPRALGAVCDVLVTLDRAQSYFRSVHRLGTDVQLRAIMPFWVIALIRADLARRMSLDPMASLNISDEQVTALLRTRGLNPVWHLDGEPVADDMGTTSGNNATADDVAAQAYTLAEAGSTVPHHPAEIDMLLHAEGCFTFLDGGTLDLGIVRDSALIERNRYIQFSESWEGVAKRGVEALRLVQKVWPTGETSGASDADLSNK